MLCGRRTCMHSGALRSAAQTPFQDIGWGGCQRRLLIGGLAKGTPNQALTPDSSTLPATCPSSVWVGAMGDSVTCAISGAAANTQRDTAPKASFFIFFLPDLLAVQLRISPPAVFLRFIER